MTEGLKSASSAKIGKIFKAARKELGLSKVEVSNVAIMNIKYINAIESGDYSIFPSERDVGSFVDFMLCYVACRFE